MHPFRILFSFLSLAFFLHHAEDWDEPVLTAIALVLSIAIYFIKDWRWSWALYSLITLPVLLEGFPTQANHSNFLMFLGIWIVYYFWRKREAADLALVARTSIYSLAVVYFMAGFHKLNADFFDPAVSCANHMLGRYVEDFGFSSLNPAELRFLPYLAIGLEFLLPLLLLFRRTFPLALLCAVLLHGFLAPIGFIDFGSIAFALLIFHTVASGFLTEGSQARVAGAVKFYIPLQWILGGMMYFLVDGKWEDPLYRTQAVFVFVFYLYVVVEVFLSRKGAQTGTSAQGERQDSLAPIEPMEPMAAFAKGPVLALFLFGFTSYLGLSTAGNFSMFSNLRTEGNFWNHLLVPRAVRIFSYQDKIHWMQAIDSEFHESGGRHPEMGYGMPTLEFYRLYRTWKRRGGSFPTTFRLYKDENWDPKEMESALVRLPVDKDPYSSWEMSLLYFRKIQPPGPNQCRW